MIESTFSPQYRSNQQFTYSELSHMSPASRSDHTHTVLPNNISASYSATNETCLPSQNGFYGPGMGAVHSDSTIASSPESFTYNHPNPAMTGVAPGMTPSHCVNGAESTPHYPTIVSKIFLSTIRV